jgi:pimeloyl-ACP methyl ester carboxylesterase
VLSQGLHAATLCADSIAPWGPPTASRAEREAALRDAGRALRPAEVAPYDRRTAIGHGLVETCRRWPPMRAAPPAPAADLPDVPALLLAGDRDLSTPLSWAREELRHAPGGKLVVVPRIGHSTLGRDPGGVARREVAAFLGDLPTGPG